MPQVFQVEERPHPWGEKGVRVSLEETAKRAAKGAIRPEVRTWAVECLDRERKRGGKVNSDWDRARVLLKACQDKLWVPDPVFAEYIPPARLLACEKHGDNGEICIKGDDCFVEGTLVLTDSYDLKPIEQLKAGDRIWGLDRWSEVQRVWAKGTLPVDVIKLNNGSELKLTGDHHVYVLECSKHPTAYGDRAGCSCPAEERVEKRIRVSELREGMVLPTPERIPFGSGDDDAPASADHALIEGLYLSDGWADYQKNNRFFISGQDGCPKEEQKRVVQEICAQLDVNTSWARKHITIRNKAWALRVQRMGRYAPEKHALTLNLDESRAASTLRGIMADAGANTKGSGYTLTTTSRLLATQARVLHRMFGVACGYRYIEDHGGLGRHPIHRLSTRPPRSDGKRQWLLRVKSIEREVVSLPCWDITTDDHRVYLPEHDVTVSQCDGLVVLFAAACMSVGLHVMVVGHAYNKAKQIQHVLTAVRIDRKWHYADPSMPEHIPAFPLGRCMDFTRERLLSVPNVQVLCDGAKCLVDFTQYDPDKMNFVTEGIFIGIDGVPQEQHPDPGEFAWRVRWLGDTPSISRKIRWLGQRQVETAPPAIAEPAPRQPYIQPQVVVVKAPEEKKESSSKMSTSDKLLAASVVISGVGLLLEYMRRRNTR